MNTLNSHLGGHEGKTHLDNGAMEYFINSFKVKSFLDIGCGPGGMVKLASKYGLKALGIDGDHTLSRFDSSKFVIHDYNTSGYIPEYSFDIGWSCEFVEHVYEKFLPNYVQSFTSCKKLMITYAPPGWPGHHHVNCQEEDYWVQRLQEHGFSYRPDWTEALRKSSTMNIKNPKKAFVKNRGLMFENLDYK